MTDREKQMHKQKMAEQQLFKDLLKMLREYEKSPYYEPTNEAQK